MCTNISTDIQKFKGTVKMWKVARLRVPERTGPVCGVPIIWNKWMPAKMSTSSLNSVNSPPVHRFGFPPWFGFNVLRTRKQAEQVQKAWKGTIVRVEVKGLFRTAESDEGIPCLLVEYIRFSKPKAKTKKAAR